MKPPSPTACRLLTSLVFACGLCAACGDPEPPPPEPARVPVTAETVEPAPFRATVDLFGRVEPSSRTPVQTPSTGRITYSQRFGSGLRTGEWVERGTPLFELTDEDARLRLVEAQLQHRTQLNELERTQRSVAAGIEGRVELERQEVLTELAAERLATAQAHQSELTVHAPVSGHLIVDRPVAPGAEVEAGTVIAEMAGTGAPRVDGLASASDLPRLETGQEVEAFSADGRRRLGRGRITEVSRLIAEDGAARLVATIDQDENMPPPGEGLLLRVLLEEKDATLSVPSESVMIEGGIAVVYVLEPRGGALEARRRLVQLGARDQDRIEVLDGLTAGEAVAVRGVELLTDGATAVDSRAEAERLY